MIYIRFDQIDTIEIPLDVAVCPDCETKLTISPDGWTEDENGEMYCDSYTSWCESEPDIEDREAWAIFDNSHPSFDTPYIDWMPVNDKIDEWLKANYRFILK